MKLFYYEEFISEEQAKRLIEHIHEDVRNKVEMTSNFRDIRKQLAVVYGNKEYRYFNQVHHPKKMPKWLKKLAIRAAQIQDRPDCYYNQVLYNRFSNGYGIGMHTDAEDIYKDKYGNVGAVAVVSIGDTKTPHIVEGEKYTVEHCSLFVMSSGKMRHSVGKAKGTRYSITFRHIPN